MPFGLCCPQRETPHCAHSTGLTSSTPSCQAQKSQTYLPLTRHAEINCWQGNARLTLSSHPVPQAQNPVLAPVGQLRVTRVFISDKNTLFDRTGVWLNHRGATGVAVTEGQAWQQRGWGRRPLASNVMALLFPCAHVGDELWNITLDLNNPFSLKLFLIKWFSVRHQHTRSFQLHFSTPSRK